MTCGRAIWDPFRAATCPPFVERRATLSDEAPPVTLGKRESRRRRVPFSAIAPDMKVAAARKGEGKSRGGRSVMYGQIHPLCQEEEEEMAREERRGGIKKKKEDGEVHSLFQRLSPTLLPRPDSARIPP